MKISAIQISAFALALGTVAASVAQTSPEKRLVTLNEAIQLALKHQPDLASAKFQAAAADQFHRQSKAAYLPLVSVGLTTGEYYSSNTNSAVSTTRQADVQFSYKLLDSGQRSATEQSAKASSKAANLSAEDQRQATIAGTATAYFEVLRQKALVEVQASNVTRAQAILDLTTAQVEAGAQAQKDVYQARADVETAKVNLLNVQNNLSIAQAQLKQAIGLEDDQEIDAFGIPSGELISSAPQKSLGAYTQEAYETRPDILRAQQNVERERAGVRLAKANNGISLSLDTNLSSVFWETQNNSRSVALTASLPLFNGGANRAAIRQSEETLKSVESNLASIKNAARVDVETAYRTRQTAQAAISAARTAQNAAEINFSAASESLKEGVGTVVDVITAQNQLVEAQTNYVQAIYTFYSADVSLQRAIGKADEVLRGVK